MSGKALMARRSAGVMTLASVMLLVVGVAPALAHHAEVEASAECDGSATIIVSSWTTGLEGQHPDVRVYVDGDFVGSGAFTAGSYEFTIYLAGQTEGSHEVYVDPVGPWGNGRDYGDDDPSGDARYGEFTVPQTSSTSSTSTTTEPTTTTTEGTTTTTEGTTTTSEATTITEVTTTTDPSNKTNTPPVSALPTQIDQTELPQTGIENGALTAIGFAMVIGGAGLLIATRAKEETLS